MWFMIHGRVPCIKELFSLKRLREEVRRIFVRSDEGHHDLHVLNALADKEMTTFHVLDTALVLGVVRDGDRRLHARHTAVCLRVHVMPIPR